MGFDNLKASLALDLNRGGNHRREVMIKQLPHLSAKKIPLAIGHAATDGEIIVDTLKTKVVSPGETHCLDDRGAV